MTRVWLLLTFLSMSVAATATHCPYCALQCGVTVSPVVKGVHVAGNAAFPVNNGTLCVKGWSAGDTLRHPERLVTPFVRREDGLLEPASWDEALDLATRRFSEIQARYGNDSVGVFGGTADAPAPKAVAAKPAPVAIPPLIPGKK